MKKIVSILLLSILLLTVFILPIHANEGTEGDELQVLQPEQLEIQLGASLAGAEFSLRTDAGMYPGTIAADENGVLRLEIGGSDSYVLTRLETAGTVPEEASAAVQSEKPTLAEYEPSEVPTDSSAPAQPNNAIPTQHIILFAGGAVLCIGFLIASYFFKRRKERRYQDDGE